MANVYEPGPEALAGHMETAWYEHVYEPNVYEHGPEARVLAGHMETAYAVGATFVNQLRLGIGSHL